MPMSTSDTTQFTVKAYHGSDPFCFVSYAHHESDIIFDEIRHLTRDGFRVYYDEGIHPGHKWHDELASAIERCKVFVLYVTANSIQSDNCLRELNFALERQIPVLAIHLEDVQLPSGIQLALGDRQAIIKSRFEEEDYRARVGAALVDYLGLSPQDQSAALVPSTTELAIAGKNTASKPMLLAGLLVLILLGGVAGFLYYQNAQRELVDYESALIQIDKLIQKDRFTDAYLIIQKLDPKQDPRRSEYSDRIVVPGTLKIANEGVEVSFKPYGDQDVDWFQLGLTPFSEPISLPRGELHFKLELAGHTSREFVAKNPGPMFGNGFYLESVGRGRFTQEPIRLWPVGEVSNEMVEVPKSNQPLFLAGWTTGVLGLDLVRETPKFFVSKFEVTNLEYKEFVDAGGYEDPDYWHGMEFVDKDNTLSFEEALALFVDKTSRAGPSTWVLSNFGEGEANLPVGGISWYEAVAYSRFRGLILPTIYHWVRLAYGPIEGLYPIAGAVSKASNFGSSALAPSADQRGLGPWGTYHTAGNVREWIWNEAGELGLIMGSSWQSYGNYSQTITAPRMNRHETNGIRLVKNDLYAEFDAAMLEPINVVYDDPYTEREPIADEAYEVMHYQFTAPRREPLEVAVKRIQETDLWTVDEHRLKYSASETFVMYIFKPTALTAPYQTILYGPPGDAFVAGLSNQQAINQVRNFNYILRGGRAVVLPIWTASYERFVPPVPDAATIAARQRIGALSWYRDAADSINYIESLGDLSTENLTYMAYSYGAAIFGPLITALENRIMGSIFVSGGLVHTTHLNPMLDGINYLPRINKPVLMLNGFYDHAFPWEQSAKRSFDLLGTPEPHKKIVGFDAGHIGFPENQLIAEVTDWLDKYMGPVR